MPPSMPTEVSSALRRLRRRRYAKMNSVIKIAAPGSVSHDIR